MLAVVLRLTVCVWMCVCVWVSVCVGGGVRFTSIVMSKLQKLIVAISVGIHVHIHVLVVGNNPSSLPNYRKYFWTYFYDKTGCGVWYLQS